MAHASYGLKSPERPSGVRGFGYVFRTATVHAVEVVAVVGSPVVAIKRVPYGSLVWVPSRYQTTSTVCHRLRRQSQQPTAHPAASVVVEQTARPPQSNRRRGRIVLFHRRNF